MLPLTLMSSKPARAAATGAAALALVATGGVASAHAAPRAATTAPACHGAALAVTAGGENAGAGHAGIVVRFRNTSAHTCSLIGYPGVDALAKNGTALRHAKRVLAGYLGGAKTIQPVSIRPGHYASALLEWVAINDQAKQCRTSAAIAITPANTRRTVRRDVHVTICQLEIHPTVSGKQGTGDLQ